MSSFSRSVGFLVCTTCFGLTSAGTGMQRCRCEEYKAYPGVDCPSGFQLCYMCAASVAGGTGRYSWNVCESCLKFNRKLGSKYGVSLPLGRHSIMNGLGIPMHATKRVQEEAAKELLNFIDVAGSISDWARCRRGCSLSQCQCGARSRTSSVMCGRRSSIYRL